MIKHGPVERIKQTAQYNFVSWDMSDYSRFLLEYNSLVLKKIHMNWGGRERILRYKDGILSLKRKRKQGMRFSEDIEKDKVFIDKLLQRERELYSGLVLELDNAEKMFVDGHLDKINLKSLVELNSNYGSLVLDSMIRKDILPRFGSLADHLVVPSSGRSYVEVLQMGIFNLVLGDMNIDDFIKNCLFLSYSDIVPMSHEKVAEDLCKPFFDLSKDELLEKRELLANRVMAKRITKQVAIQDLPLSSNLEHLVKFVTIAPDFNERNRLCRSRLFRIIGYLVSGCDFDPMTFSLEDITDPINLRRFSLSKVLFSSSDINNIFDFTIPSYSLYDSTVVGRVFSRDPFLGTKKFCGEFMIDSPFRELLFGMKVPIPIQRLEDINRGFYERLINYSREAEKRCKFCVECIFESRGEIFEAQIKKQTQSGVSSLVNNLSLLEEGIINEDDILVAIKSEDIYDCLLPRVDFSANLENILLSSCCSSSLSISGRVCFSQSSLHNLERKYLNDNKIFITDDITVGDYALLEKCDGIITLRGNNASHAAIIAKSMGKVYAVGSHELIIRDDSLSTTSGNIRIKEGDYITIDGSGGRIFLGKANINYSVDEKLPKRLFSIIDKRRRMSIRANINSVEDAKEAFKYNVDGIGLARTEYFLLSAERISQLRNFIFSNNETVRQKALDTMHNFYFDDFKNIYNFADKRKVCIRLLDFPIGELLPSVKESVEYLENRLSFYKEINPMLGYRGVRFLISEPNFTEKQLQAIFEASNFTGRLSAPEILVPMVSNENEIISMRDIIVKVGSLYGFKYDSSRRDYKIGVMIETPRAALISDKLAKHVDFFSFGTNDLTQMVYGISRDDNLFLSNYLDRNILDFDPFLRLDIDGVGSLIDSAVNKIRACNRDLEIGVCGEHCSNFDSINFFESRGFDYISCSPSSIYAAGLGAAQAANKSD